jgi:short-subunit dehydrogenase
MRVFLTGASSGLGEALARHYAAHGATLGVFARRETELVRLASLLAPATVATYAGDVRESADLARAAADFTSRFGLPDVVIANAGISRGALTEDARDLPTFRAIFDTNVLGMVYTFAPFVAAMRTARTGTLVGIASVGGFRGLPGSGAYSGSKAAVIAYLESLRVELFRSGVAVVTVCPGFIATPMTRRNPYPMPFLVAPDKAARLIARAIEKRGRFYVVPWQMGVIGKILRCAPRALYDRALAGRARKPRNG